MKPILPVAVAISLFMGCSTSIEPIGFGKRGQQDAELAAFAAKSELPSTRPARTVPVTVLVDRKKGDIMLINGSDQAFNDLKVWVNNAYVTKLAALPPHGTETLSSKQFYDHDGHSLATTNVLVTRVDLQMGNEVVQAQGPAFK